MPFDFDLDEDQPTQQQRTDRAEAEQQLYGSIEATTPDELVDEFSEAERRFEKAQFYRVLLKQGIFEESTPTSAEVESEIRAFIRERLSVLLGITVEPSKQAAMAQFSEDEVRVLKEVASKLGAKKPGPAAPPKLRTVAPAPVAAPKPKSVAPTIKPVPAAKPAPKPPAPPPPAQTAAPEKSKGGRKKVKKTGETLKVDGVEYTEVLDAEGNKFYVSKEGQQYRIGTNEAGQYFMRNITVQAIPEGQAGTNVVAPMNKAMYEAQFAAAASQSLRAAENNPLINTILGNITQ